MPKPEMIETLNITGAGGTRLPRDKYDAVRAALLRVIPRTARGIAFRDLPRLVDPAIPASMKPRPGSTSWLVTTVKLDLEARHLIERVPGITPQHLRRCTTRKASS
jgi:hypothetical protein